MGAWQLGVKRALSQLPLLLSVTAVVALISGFLIGGTGYLGLATTTIARAQLAAASARDAAVRFETPMTKDAAAQARRIDADLARTIGAVPHQVTRTVRAAPTAATVAGVALSTSTGAAAEIALGSDEGLREHSLLVEGEWPTSGSADGKVVEGALQASAARTLGLKVGDTLVTDDGMSVRIAALWKPRDSAAPRWFADLATTGSELDEVSELRAYGPLDVPEAVLPQDGTDAQWTVTVPAGRVTKDDLATIATFSRAATAALTADRAATDGAVTTSGGLSRTAERIDAELRSLIGITPIGTILLAVIGLAALLQLANLLVATRRQESVLLRSRGASVRRIVGGVSSDAALAAVTGCIVGTAASTGVLALTEGVVTPDWRVAAAVIGATVLIFTTVALVDARRLTRRDSMEDNGRRRGTAALAATVLVSAAAALAVAQLLLYGSPVIAAGSGRPRVDPVAVSAPAIGIIATALIVLTLFGPLVAGLARAATARPGLQPFFSLAQVARRAGSFAVVVLLVAATVGTSVYLAALQSTANTLRERATELVSGAPVRVVARSGASLSVAPYVDIPGATAAPVSSEPIEVSDFTGRLIALPSSGIRRVMSPIGGAVDRAALADALPTHRLGGIALPETADRLRVTLTAGALPRFGDVDDASIVGPVGTARGSLWLQDAAGDVVQRTLDPIDLAQGQTMTESTLDLPLSVGGWHVVAADLSAGPNSQAVYTVSIAELSAQTDDAAPVPVALPSKGWAVQGSPPAYGSVDALGSIGATISTESNADARLMPARSVSRLPIAVTRLLADKFDLSVGSDIDVTLSETGQVEPATVAAVTSVVPGSTSDFSILAELGELGEHMLRSGVTPAAISEIWLSGATSRLPAVERIAGSATVSTLAAAGSSTTSVALTALWISGIGAIALALAAIVAAAVTLGRLRRPETLWLGSTGLSRREQSASRRAELLGVALFAAILGALGGIAVAALTATAIAHSVVPFSAGLPSPLGLDPLPFIPALGAEAIGVIAIAVIAATTRRQNRGGRP